MSPNQYTSADESLSFLPNNSFLQQSPINDMPFLFMTDFQPHMVNAVYKHFNIKNVPPQDLGRCFYKEQIKDLVKLIQFLLPRAAKEMGYKLAPFPNLPFWAGVVVWRYVLWFYNAPEILVCLCELTANVKLRAIFNRDVVIHKKTRIIG